jgi:hypothetical protein
VGGRDAVLIAGDTAPAKQGRRSVGVKHQHGGAPGKPAIIAGCKPRRGCHALARNCIRCPHCGATMNVRQRK